MSRKKKKLKKANAESNKYWGLSEEDMAELKIISEGEADKDQKKKWYNIHPQIQKKRSGKIKKRIIEAPVEKLKTAQRRIVDEVIYRQSDTSKHAHGFRKGRSAKTAAEVHLGAEVVLAMDVRDFFPNINREMLVESINKWCGARMRERMEDILTICLIDNRLPQGSPASPPLSNIAVRTMDNHLNSAAGHVSAKFTRYADDLVFSASDACLGCRHNAHRMLMGEVRPKTNRKMCTNCFMIGKKLNRIIPWFKDIVQDKHNLPINEKKTKIMRPGRRQTVNGLVVNKGLNSPRVPRPFRRITRNMLHNYLLDVLLGRQPKLKLSVIRGRVEHIRSAYRPHGEMFDAKLSLVRECLDNKAKKEEVRQQFESSWAKAA